MEEEKKYTLFGRDLQRIPCFKYTFMYAISSGLIGGLATFLFTSKPKRSADIGVALFTVTACGYWIVCRYNYRKESFLTQKMNARLHEIMLREGTKQEVKGSST